MRLWRKLVTKERQGMEIVMLVIGKTGDALIQQGHGYLPEPSPALRKKPP